MIENKSYTYTAKYIIDHYEIFDNDDKFLFSADNINEVEEGIKELEKSYNRTYDAYIDIRFA